MAGVSARVQESARTLVRGDYYELSFQAMNTVCRINFRAATPALAQACQAEAVQWTAAFEARYSRFIPQSIIGQINAAAGRDWVAVDPTFGQFPADAAHLRFALGGLSRQTELLQLLGGSVSALKQGMRACSAG